MRDTAPTPPLPDSADGLIEFESTAGFLHLGLLSSRLLRRHSQQPLLEKRPTSSSISLTIYKIFSSCYPNVSLFDLLCRLCLCFRFPIPPFYILVCFSPPSPCLPNQLTLIVPNLVPTHSLAELTVYVPARLF